MPFNQGGQAMKSVKSKQLLQGLLCGLSLSSTASAVAVDSSRAIFDEDAAVIVGNGCPSGSAAVHEIRHGGEVLLGIQFDDFVAAATPRARAMRLACNVRIPIQIPRGMRLHLDEALTNGYSSLDRASRGAAAVRVFMLNEIAPSASISLSGPSKGYFEIAAGALEAGCSGSLTGFLGLTLAASVQTSTSSAVGVVAIDDTSLRFHLEPCR